MAQMDAEIRVESLGNREKGVRMNSTTLETWYAL